ncbi:MAG: DNA alkylation repair protein [Spirochaetia bacterium]|nr:DNA alkylation repair protein [Spirochaetia bacterium]
MSILKLKDILVKTANPEQAKIHQRFFKTGKGEYAEGDLFYGIKVPVQRKIAKDFYNLSLSDTLILIQSKMHEERLIALFILIQKYNKGDVKIKKEIYEAYLKNTNYINNWDLIDTSAEHIVGNYLIDKDKTILYKLAESKSLWERRIAIMATFHYIKNKNYKETYKIAEILLNDDHDLIHKAVGWMLREAGKRDFKLEENFLKKHYKNMPRTMLRYAIEKFPEELRQMYLKGKVKT